MNAILLLTSSIYLILVGSVSETKSLLSNLFFKLTPTALGVTILINNLEQIKSLF